jgi:hypothetical protein
MAGSPREETNSEDRCAVSLTVMQSWLAEFR